MIRFYNTLGGAVETFAPIRPGEVKLYTCGPTVYDFPHIGNWRAYVFEDLLKRFLVFSGFKVTHVMNITDVDDKTIRGAKALGVSLKDYTKKFIDAFFGDLETLNILPAEHYPRATDHIPDMVGLIKRLLSKGFAYRKDGSIYFSIAKFPAYGRLSKIRLDELRPGRRSDADEYEKESVHDFALWKAPKEGEPVWETEIGPGRPGWHIECSAMSSKYLGPTFDIHCGGIDNIFPHHENEIAQSEAANGVKFVNTWLHCHHLVVDGEKMAKSKGNVYTLGHLTGRGEDPLSVRFLLLSTHYRKMLNFTFDALAQAGAARRRMLDFLYELGQVSRDGEADPEVAVLVETARAGFSAGLEDDLNISESLASLFGLIKNVNILLASGKVTRKDAEDLAGFFRSIDTVLGVIPDFRKDNKTTVQDDRHPTDGNDVRLEAESAQVDEAVQRKIEARQRARAERNYQLADEIRKELLAQGILLEDTKDGVRWKKVNPARP